MTVRWQDYAQRPPELPVDFRADAEINDLRRRARNARVSADRGNGDVTLSAGDVSVQRFATALTADRTITLPTTGLVNGSGFRVVRSATGAFTLNVGAATTLAAGQWCDVMYDGTDWVVTAKGTL